MQDVVESDLEGLSHPVMWASFNSGYYFGSEIMSFAKSGDYIFSVGHEFGDTVTTAAHMFATDHSTLIEANSSYVIMKIAGTEDYYQH